MKKHLNTKTTKEFERKELLKLEGQEVIGVAKFTEGKNYRGNIVLRLITEIKIYKPNGEVLLINHLWIPLEDTKHSDRVWSKHTGHYRKFKGIVSSYGYEQKKASLNIQDIEKDIWKFDKKLNKRKG